MDKRRIAMRLPPRRLADNLPSLIHKRENLILGISDGHTLLKNREYNKRTYRHHQLNGAGQAMSATSPSRVAEGRENISFLKMDKKSLFPKSGRSSNQETGG